VSTVTVDGVTIEFDDEGSGDPVVLIHGHPFDRTMWRPQATHLSRSGRRVIAPDLRGYGRSTVLPGMTTLTAFAQDVATLLDRLGIETVVLGGLSMGGQIALEFHRLYPHRLHGLVLADTSAQAETDEGKKARNDTAERLLRDGMARYADEMLPEMLAAHTIRALPAVAQHVLGMMRRTPAEGAAAALRGRAERPDYVDMLARISVPTLVVVGSEDGFTPVGDAQFMSERIPGAILAVIGGAGHMPNLERPDEFNTELQRFLDRSALSR
jgi:pimeloyl-ACP methyl ester carboxylesterase